MRKIARADVKNILEYERVRGEFRRRIIDLKKGRRVTVGSLITLVFENRDTVLFQIEEMMRAERIVEEERIKEEIATYNALIPNADELSATLLIEITDLKKIKPTLNRLMGLDQGDRVWIQFGNEQVYGAFEEGRSTEDKISAVHFLRFEFTTQQSRRFRSGEDRVFLHIDHPSYKRKTTVPDEVLTNLREDLEP